ncbi:unnamed protein product [Dovyalis caffra]|uniref:Uncharacterized protein n=1 Tax=Dovyalis caffra TaxID=77055 RepID=A0AAV1SV97_9ROSI|nr:unnamed protein product [Dovyalis caffra]
MPTSNNMYKDDTDCRSYHKAKDNLRYNAGRATRMIKMPLLLDNKYIHLILPKD